jgi:dipeptidyl aminopeptidase/acylaminoacyl peptidase
MKKRAKFAVTACAITRSHPVMRLAAFMPLGVFARLLVVLLAAMAIADSTAWAAEAVSPQRLLELTDLGNPTISPDGQRVAFRTEQASVERNTYDTAWYVQAIDGASPPRRIADGGVPLRQYVNGVVQPSPALWSPDGRWIYYRARLDERISIWRAAADGSGAQEITSDPADVREFRLSPDGRTLEYSVGATRDQVLAAEQSEYDNGVHLDDTVVVAGALFQSSRLEGRPATQKFLGDWFSTGPLLAHAPSGWKAIDLDSMVVGGLDAALPRPHPLLVTDLAENLSSSATAVAQEPAGERVALLIPAKEDGQLKSRYVELSVLSHKHASHAVRCTADACSRRYITDIRWRPGTDEVLFTTTNFDKGRAQSIYAWNVSTNAVRQVVLSDGLVSGSQRYWDVPCAGSLAKLVCVAAEADRPPRLEAIDAASGQRRILFEPNKALEADIAATVPARLLHWHDEQGREFTGHLFEARRAPGSKPPPLFLTFYNCYGFLRGGVGDEWPLATLAQQGISALCINAVPEYRQDFAARYEQGTAAVESVVRFLSAQGKIDPSHVGMGGISYGSEVTLWTLIHSRVISAASISGGASTPTYYLFNSLREAFRSGLKTIWQLGSPEETPALWRQVSPVYHIDQIRAPLLFQFPEQEFRIALDYAVPLIRRHLADMYIYPDEAHMKFQPRHKLSVYERNLDWFRFWLQGYEDSSPAKAGQYAIWRGMRARTAPAACKADAGAQPSCI